MERKNNVLIWLLCLFILTTIGLLGYIIFYNFNAADNECEDVLTNTSNTCEKTNELDEQMIFGDLGTVFITNQGNVYFEPATTLSEVGYDADLTEPLQKVLGKPSKYELESDKFFEGKRTFSYQLELALVRSAYEYELGNGGCEKVILFVHVDGSVSELKFSCGEFKFTRYLPNYTNIVSVVEDDFDDGYHIKFIDKCGNSVIYKSSEK